MKFKSYPVLALICVAVIALLWLKTTPETNPSSRVILPPSLLPRTAVPATNQTSSTQFQSLSQPTLAVTKKLFRTPAILWNEPTPEQAFARFKEWTQRYLPANPTSRASLIPEGVALAAERRTALKQMIKDNPERALELTVPAGLRARLPTEVVAWLEETINAPGKLAVLGVLAESGRESEIAPDLRIATAGDREYQTYTYGERLGVPTRNRIALNGIAVDDFFALSENALRILDSEEAAAVATNPDPLCSVTAQSALASQSEVVAELAGEIVFFCRPEHAVEQNEKIVAADSGPPSPDAGDVEASAWTEGQKKLLLIRVDFPDLVGVGLSDIGAVTLINHLNNFYTEMSYGRASFASNTLGSDFTPVFRMPQPAAYYGTNDYYNQLRSEARNAAATAGYTLTNYHLDVICMGPVPGFGWAGLGYVGSAGSWLRNNFSTGVAAHELGHNYGLNHANFWNTSGASIIGPGSSSEYGDSFDTMGAASAGNNHFNARYKHYLNWLTTNEVVTATTNGTYRIVCHDNAAATGIRGLKIIKNSSTNYWVEFRQKFNGNQWLMNGAGLRWAQNGNQKSQLLDTTPGSTDGKTDSALVIGRTFSDLGAGIHITPIGKGGTTPESLDVVVNLGFFPSNHPPIVDITASETNVGAGVSVTFTTSASDADGDALAYYWEFGDGSFGTNGPVAGKSWNSDGDYLVRCVVSDMKGGAASKWVIVRVGMPDTYRILGNVATVATPVQGARIHVSTTRMGYTDSDGNYAIVGLPAGAYTVDASLYEYTFAPANFTNTVSVGPDAEDVDFLATLITYPATITTQPFSQTVAAGASALFTVAAGGSSPLAYQWRFNTTNLLGATSNSFTVVNVQAANTGNYSVVVSNAYGSVTSSIATLSLGVPPGITTQPQPQRVVEGNTATFSVVATGTQRLNYQWRQNGTNIYGGLTGQPGGSNGEGGSFKRDNVQPAHAGDYSVVVSNPYGMITSAVATLTVSVRPQLSLPQFVSGAVQFSLSGTPGDRYTVESSTNLLHWTPAATISNVAGQVWYLDPESSHRPAKFYRGKLE
jgi:hypothetical protein